MGMHFEGYFLKVLTLAIKKNFGATSEKSIVTSQWRHDVKGSAENTFCQIALNCILLDREFNGDSDSH